MMVTELGWDFEKIGSTSWPDVTNLLNYWHKSPPLNQLLNLWAKAKGLRIVTKTEPTDFEKRVQEKTIRPMQVGHLPAHLRELIKEVEEGKHKRGGQRG